MTKKTLAWFGLLLVVIFGLTWATTRVCVMHMRGEPSTSMEGMASWSSMMGLSEEQRKLVDPMEKKLAGDLRPIEMELASQRIELCRLLGRKEVNTQELDQTLKTIGDLHMKQQAQVVHHLVALKGVLTPDQEQKLLKSMMSEICQNCRAAQGENQDLCGMCGMK